MSENVKIQIKEIDNTSPAGRGIDSTDIAFIPGFSILPDAPKNEPILVTSTSEFNALFGASPLVLTNQDVSDYLEYGFKAGDVDRSYVYAKELLLQGMPVVYANVVDDDSVDVLTEINNSTVLKNKNATELESDTNYTIELDDKKDINISCKKDVENEERIIQFDTTLNLEAGKDTTFEYFVNADGCKILETFIDTESFKNLKSKYTTYKSNTQVDFTSTETEKVKIAIRIKALFTMSSKDKARLTVKKVNGSRLDAFYKTLIVCNLLDIPSVQNPVDNTIADKSVYSVKYITSGGYPSVVTNTRKDKQGNISRDNNSVQQMFSAEMIAAAKHRGDAVALIDYQLDPLQNVFGISDNSFYAKVHNTFDGKDDSGYGTMMYPWAIHNTTTQGNIEMPASFSYLMCVAKTIKTSPNWLAMAGVTRGLVPGIQELLVPNKAISNFIAEEMQPKFGEENHRLSVNTITNIRPYGLTLWGNRTLKPVSNDGTVALNFLNTRNMLSDIKKLLYTTAKACMFEQNSDDLWLRFKDGIRPLLDRMKAGSGISDYKIVRGTTKYNGDPLTKGEIAAVIKIYPMYAVEYFELAVEINDEEVTID